MKRGMVVLVTTAVLGACGQLPTRSNDEAAALRPQLAAPARNVTDFSDAVRCMDDTFMRYGTRDVSVIMEDLADNTKKVSAGTRDMMISAISDMTRRSRAIQLITFGQDANNLVAFLNAAQQRGAFAVVPQFSIRGSVSQLDEGVLKRQGDVGISVDPVASLGASASRQFNVLGLDLSMAHTSNLALVHGVSSKNAVVIAKDSNALDSEAVIRKVGINFSTSFQRTDGTAQALRNMVELATVELFGRLLKLPYWACLGATPDNAEVRNEIEDWFIGMERAGELVGFFQEQLRNRGFYDGPVDGQVNDALRQAIAAYQSGTGFTETGVVDLDFFTAFMNNPFPPAPAQPFAPPAPVTIGAARKGLQIVPTKTRYRAGEGVEFELRSPVPAYAYCYHEDSAHKFTRIFPNRFQRDPRIAANRPLRLPGKASFKLAAHEGVQESITCFSAPRELYNSVPAALRWGDFQMLGNVSDFDDVRRLLEAVNKEPVAEAGFSYIGQPQS